MKSNFLRIIFDIIILIVLAVLIFYIITMFIGITMGDEARYVGYLNSIADSINNINNKNYGRIFISNYDYNYVFVLTNKDGWYLQLYRCLPPNQVVDALSVKIAYWNVSTINDKNTIIFAPALEYCKLIKQRSLNVDEINIKIQGLNVDAGLLAYSSNEDLSNRFQIFISITDLFFSTSSMVLTIVNDTTITCNNDGCRFTSPNVRGDIYCAPNPNINYKSQNLPYNPSKCVELSGFPRSPQVSYSNLVGEIEHSVTFGNTFEEIFGIDFPILYFAGSLPPTVIYIDTYRDGKTAYINIYIGETIPK